MKPLLIISNLWGGGKVPLPNASYVRETNECYFKPYVPPISLCDIAYWDGSKVKTVSQDKWNSGLGTAIGVVVIPSGFAPDGKARIVSLKYAVDINGTSSTNASYLSWGPTGTDTSLTNYTKVPTTDNAGSTSTGSYSSGYLPSDNFTGATSFVDSKAKYSRISELIPSPYITRDGKNEFNPEYSKAISGNNALSDFSGSANTQTLVGLGADYIAANACWNYKDGSSNLQWYLPAAGELGFLVPRFNAINSTLTTVGGSSVASDYFWSSSEYSSDYAYYVSTGNGYVGSGNKRYNVYVRPFAVLP